MASNEAAGIRVVVVGATGNVGTSVVAALGQRAEVASIRGIARRPATWTAPKFSLSTADIGTDDLRPLLRGADVIIHLAWLFQPTRHPEVTWRNNVIGAIRVFEAAAAEGVPTIVYASSVAAYSQADPHRAVDESWPTDGWGAAAYPREKAYVERWLDGFEASHPDTRVVRMRPAFIFKRNSATSQRRLFGGPFVPGRLAVPTKLPWVPQIDGLSVQVVHTDDVGAAYAAAATRPVHGAFNLGSEPAVDSAFLADYCDARTIPVSSRLVKAGLGAAWRARLVPATPGLFDTVMHLPLLDSARARAELSWAPRPPTEALDEFFAGLQSGAGTHTAPLAPDSVAGRADELRTGVGGHDS
ncbi:NAD-dependent epimerase/dehydratase family protein [Gordonia sp. Z-3]|jgi:nucleoside-diphosphate-sugar epimerase|uniref:NAD-dependent epimerase/dehydratase family protein n=1 Tax=Gordonia aquimaris TaxID=2984863 RepID=A0A9X3D399_9ACTN|nr:MULTISPECIES: NAD-dependent epimerase/dehydratase family protein [Gordonia]MAU80403.1 NAD-dependent epimerase [Gordonia sp. (in: high G+C Gram-positive bacteria)]MCX2964238.1 NAD-dependent epimerase/dehydratase family protein [Gordonia aquimaris]MED5801842.1 NAD-dependent epimerase/dehydratase family protein [Gordonia sp. Z-3]